MAKSKPFRRFVAALSLFTLVSANAASASEEPAYPYWCYNGTCCRLGSPTPHDCQYNCGYILSGYVTDELVNMSCSA